MASVAVVAVAVAARHLDDGGGVKELEHSERLAERRIAVQQQLELFALGRRRRLPAVGHDERILPSFGAQQRRRVLEAATLRRRRRKRGGVGGAVARPERRVRAEPPDEEGVGHQRER